MKTILILGGYGQTGRLLARHLLEKTDVKIVLAGRHIEKARTYEEQLNSEFKGERVVSRHADAANETSMNEVLRGVDLLLVASPTTQYADTVIRAALDAKVDYLDIQLDTGKTALLQAQKDKIHRSGLCFITEAGFHPGLPSVLVRWAAAQLDRLDTAITAGYLNMGRALPYTEAVDELMEIFKHYQAQVYRNGAWTKSSAYERRKINFGGEIGIKNCFSMFFEELLALPEMFPGLRETGFYMSESHWVVDWLLTPIVFAGLKLAPERGIKPMGKLMWWGMQHFLKPPHIIQLNVEATGQKNDEPARIGLSVSHPDGYELTAIPVVACLMQVLDGTARKPGLWMMGHLVNPVRLLGDMHQMGVQINTSLD